MKIAELYLRQKNQRIDKAYHYLVPDNVEIGQRVNIPFGKGNRILEGIITGFSEDTSIPNLKSIDSIIDEESLISPEQIELVKFLKGQIFGLFYEHLNNVTSPIKTKKGKTGRFSSYKPKKDYWIILIKKEKVRGTIQEQILEALSNKPLKFSELKKIVSKATLKTLDRLQDLGLIEFSEIKENRIEKIIKKETSYKKEFIKLNQLSLFIDLLKERINSNRGQILIILPNNFLAQQLHSYLNKNGIENSFYNPEFTSEENYRFYMDTRNGNNKIIVSTFKGIFLNFYNLKTIFLTYTGDESYSAGQVNHFNILDLSEKLAEVYHADLFFIDFIDSIISNFNIRNNNWKYSRNIEEVPSKNIEIDYIDQIDENSSIFSNTLKENLIKNFKNKTKTLLVLNRKGYFNYYYCSKCHQPLKCPRCGSILRGIKSDKEVECRLCGFTGKFPDECSSCGNKEFKKFQIGIERVLEEVKKLIPEAKIVPYFNTYQGDVDSADIIVGTSQVLFRPKINNVKTVGAVLVDIDLNYPDYQAPEAAYRFYSDLFNRYSDANIIVQSQYYKNSFLNALNNNSEIFFKEQEEYRKLAEVPPFSDIYMITLTGPNSQTVKQDIQEFQKNFSDLPGVKVLKAHVLRRIKGVSQRRFLIKDKNKILRDYFKQLYEDGQIENFVSRVSILINPSNTN